MTLFFYLYFTFVIAIVLTEYTENYKELLIAWIFIIFFLPFLILFFILIGIFIPFLYFHKIILE